MRPWPGASRRRRAIGAPRPSARADATTGSRRSTPPRAGFTLIELLVVVGVLALIAQIVMFNMGAMVPRTVLDGEARRMMGMIEFLRSEAMLQGKTYTLELDLDNDRYRVILPPEERLVSHQTIAESGLELGWTYLDERVDLSERLVMLGAVARSKRVRIVFDERGFTADQVIVLRMKAREHEGMVWTIQIRGLQRRTELVTSFDGNVAAFEIIEEAAFR